MIRLAEDLGSEVIRVEGTDVAGELARVARERHVTQILVGQPAQSRWHELVFGSVVNRLLRQATGANIHTIASTP
jgi:two-component system sensor histidine kinase KdpD